MFDTYKGIFDERAQTYHQAMQDCPFAREKEFFNVIELADLKDGDVVCDIPAGGCYLSHFLKEKVKLISVETSIEFVKYGKGTPFHQRLLCQDISCIPLKSNCIDKIISLAGLHHLKAKVPFYREVHRLLKRGGVFSVADVRKNSPPARFLNTFVHENNYMGHRGDFIDQDTKEELELAGFRVEYAKPVGFFWKFDSRQTMTKFCKQLFGIDLANHEQVFDGIKNYLGYERQNGSFCANWELCYFKAVKP